MDTIVYYIHNITTKYPIIEKSIKMQPGKGHAESPIPDHLLNTKDFPTLYKYFYNTDIGLFVLRLHHTKLKLPSFASDINVALNTQEDWLKIEFSIPKFFFGNNVCEIIPPLQYKHFTSKFDMQNLCLEFWYQLIRKLPNLIIKCITKGLQLRVDKTDVEIARLDICFNQYFETIQDCRHYYDVVSKATLPRLDNGQKNEAHRESGGVWWKPTGYFFKVYLKGPEFDKNGLNKIRSNYELYQKMGLLDERNNLVKCMRHIYELQDYAHHLIRYELECTSTLFSDLFKTHMYKQYIPQYKEMKRLLDALFRQENYNLMLQVKKRYVDEHGQLHKRKPKLSSYHIVYFAPANLIDTTLSHEHTYFVQVVNERTHKRIAKLIRYQNILRRKYLILDRQHLKELYKTYRKDQDKAFKFFLETDTVDAAKAIYKEYDAHYDVHAMGILEEAPKKQKFSRQLLYHCMKKFINIFSDLQCQQLPSFKDLELRVIDHNKTARKKIRLSTVKMIMTNLSMGSWSDIRNSGGYDRSTIYRQKKKIESILGLDKAINFIDGLQSQNVPRDPTELYKKHYDLMVNTRTPLSIFLQNTPLLLSV